MNSNLPNSIVIHDVNEIYPMIGDGKYQIWLIVISCLTTFPIGVQELILYFLAFDPGWQCSNSSERCKYNTTLHTSNSLYKERCRMNRSDWEFASEDKFSIVTEFGLYCEKEYWIETSSTIFYLGNLLGALMLGWLSDRFGRPKVAFISSLMVLLSSFCTAFVKSLWLFECLRFITGLTISGTYMVLVVLCSEVTGKEFRAAAGQCLWFFYPSGIALSGLLAYYLQQWRHLLICTSAPFSLILIFLWFLPDSFIWLHAHRKEEALLKEIKRVAKMNNKVIPENIVFKWKEESKEESSGTRLRLFLKPRKMLMTTLSLMFAWFALGLVYFGISLAADNLTGDAYRDFSILVIMDVPAAIMAILSSSRLGRKKTIVSTMFIGSLCVLVIGFIPESSSKSSGFSIARLTLGIAGKLLTTISFDVLITWCLELYPTKLRSSANGLFNSISIIGSMCSPWVGIWLRHIKASVPFFTMGGCAILSSLFLIWLPETMGKHLPQALSSITNEVVGKNELAVMNKEVVTNDVVATNEVAVMNEEVITNEYVEVSEPTAAI